MRDGLAARIAAGVLAIGLGTAAAWNPISPFAMDRANRAYLAGDTARARAIWEAVAEGWHPAAERADAAERAARMAVRDGEPVDAVRWLHLAIRLSTGAERAARQRALAEVYTARFGDFRRAGALLKGAAEANGDAAMMVEAARDLARAEAWEEAAAAWTVALARLDDPALVDEAQAGLLRAERHTADAGEVADDAGEVADDAADAAGAADAIGPAE